MDQPRVKAFLESNLGSDILSPLPTRQANHEAGSRLSSFLLQHVTLSPKQTAGDGQGDQQGERTAAVEMVPFSYSLE